ncbi:MAG: MCE family protein, partial [Amphiplicatus sp.]|nr:MCE family protein [Amphiplicatus sp.]
METRAHYVLVGAFVLCAIAFAFLFILWLGQTQREFDEYDVIFTERVSGLSNGAAVRFNGIQKGEVAQLRIDPDDPSIVIARVRVERDTPVKTDTKAELELVGFTGLAVIQFVGGSKDAPLLKEMTRGVPRIKADASGFAAFLEGSGDIVEAANRMLSPANTEAVAHILANIDEITTVFAEQHENLALTIENSAQIT